MDRGPNHNNGSGFYYPGALEMRSVPETSVATALAIGVGVLLGRHRRRED